MLRPSFPPAEHKTGQITVETSQTATPGSHSLTITGANVNVTAGFGGTISFSCTGVAQITCSFSPATVQPVVSTPATTSITIRAGSSGLAANHRVQLLALALVLPMGITLTLHPEKRALRSVPAVFTLLLLILGLLSCGGSGGGGGGGGSSTFAITVSASATGTNTSRSLGTLNVTVTH